MDPCTTLCCAQAFALTVCRLDADSLRKDGSDERFTIIALVYKRQLLLLLLLTVC